MKQTDGREKQITIEFDSREKFDSRERSSRPVGSYLKNRLLKILENFWQGWRPRGRQKQIIEYCSRRKETNLKCILLFFSYLQWVSSSIGFKTNFFILIIIVLNWQIFSLTILTINYTILIFEISVIFISIDALKYKYLYLCLLYLLVKLRAWALLNKSALLQKNLESSPASLPEMSTLWVKIGKITPIYNFYWKSNTNKNFFFKLLYFYFKKNY